MTYALTQVVNLRHLEVLLVEEDLRNRHTIYFCQMMWHMQRQSVLSPMYNGATGQGKWLGKGNVRKVLTGIHARLRTRLTAYRIRGPVCSAKPPWVHTTKDARPRNTYRNDLER